MMKKITILICAILVLISQGVISQSLNDNFNDGNHLGWFDLMYNGTNTWQVESGELHVTYNIVDETPAVILSPVGAVSDFTFEVMVGKNVAGDWCNEAGIGRFSDSEGRCIQWRVDIEEEILELTYNDGSGNVELFSETITMGTQLYPMKLQVSGDAPTLTVTAWWDGVQKWSGDITEASETLAQGQLAMLVSNHASQEVSVWFDDISITYDAYMSSFPDNFNDGNYLGWFDLMYNGTNTWQVESGELHAAYNITDELPAVILSPVGAVSDFTFEMMVGKNVAGDWCNEAGIGRFSDSEGRGIQWRIDIEEEILELTYNDGSGNVELFSETITMGTQLYPMKLQVSGDAPTLTLTAWWDGVQKWSGDITEASETLAQGQLALLVSNHASQEVSVWFDDVSITYDSYVTKIKLLEVNSAINIFPNPTQDILTVTLQNPNIQDVDVVIYDITGKIVFMEKFNTNSFQINTSNLKSGNYILKLKDNYGYLLTSKKIIKE